MEALDISWGELESSGPIRVELAHGMLGKGGGHSVGRHKHTAVHFCQLSGPGALHLFGKIGTGEVIVARTEPGLKGPDSSPMKMSLFLTPGEKDAVEAILTLASGTILIPKEVTSVWRQRPGIACLLSYPE